MFRVFELAEMHYDENDQPIPLGEPGAANRKICINLKEVSAIIQVQVAEAPRVRGRDRQQRYVVAKNYFNISTVNGNSWNVMGDFDELIEFLAVAQTKKESI